MPGGPAGQDSRACQCVQNRVAMSIPIRAYQVTGTAQWNSQAAATSWRGARMMPWRRLWTVVYRAESGRGGQASPLPGAAGLRPARGAAGPGHTSAPAAQRAAGVDEDASQGWGGVTRRA
ncbi:hypothetical protein CTU88_40040 [Streptomyces sp. JV178]|nr:hypothetical protein CTU88_40040 [Streptomyces sp. JV178]